MNSLRLSNYRRYSFNYEGDDMEGGGVKDFITGIPTALSGRPKILNDLITEYDDIPIIHISVCRQPIYSIFERGLNFLTMGALRKKMVQLGYDKLFHLYMVVTFEGGDQWYIEKNQRVNAQKFTTIPENAECTTQTPFNKTLKDMIETVESKQIPGLYRYDAFKDNCQKFVYDVLNSNGISEHNDFIIQDVSKLAPRWLKYAARFITDIGGVIDYVYRGGSYDETPTAPVLQRPARLVDGYY